jgi:hypothetical protein
MIWDFCPDMMHIIKTFFERLVLGVFSGSRKPNYTYVKPTKPTRDATVDAQEVPGKNAQVQDTQGRVRRRDQALQ